MLKFIVIATALTVAMTGSAMAKKKADTTATTPASTQAASDSSSTGTAPSTAADVSAGKGHGHGHHGHGLHSEKHVLALSSLTPDQKTKITAIYDGLRTDTQPLAKEMRSLSGKGKAGGKKGKGNTAAYDKAIDAAVGSDTSAAKSSTPAASTEGDGSESAGRISELRKSIRDKRAQAWDKVKAILTPAQLQELSTPPAAEKPSAPKSEMTDGASSAPASSPAPAPSSPSKKKGASPSATIPNKPPKTNVD